MTANAWLAKERGLSDESIAKISRLHDLIENLIKDSIGKGYSESLYNEIEGYEYLLQHCWGFPEDCGFHTLKKVYKLKNQWCNRTFKCLDTEETFTIPYDVKERDFFSFGKAFIDVGRVDGYYRMGGNIKEITNENSTTTP